MTPLIFTAALALASPSADASAPATSFVLKKLPDAPLNSFVKPQLQMQLQGVACGKRATQTLGPNGAPITKLGDLPPALEEHAVLRTIHGCPVREIVSGGRTYYLDAPTGGLERLNPTAYRVNQH